MAIVSEKVVTERLEKVATQLAKVTKSPEASTEALEEELLNDTPIGSPKVKDEAPVTPPSEPTAPTTIVMPSKPDGLDHRLHQIFGKRRANDENGPETSPKVANIIADDTGANEKAVSDMVVVEHNVVTNITSTSGASKDTNNVVNNITTPPGNADASNTEVPSGSDAPGGRTMEIDGEPEVENQGNANAPEPDNQDDDHWAEQDDQPEDFPDVGFPMQVPGYPMQPIFEYRYRTVNSTPRSRRIDFDNAIVLRKCVRDPHTGRIPQEEYEAREDAEMALSLGYVITYGLYLRF